MAESDRRLFFALWPPAGVAGRLHEAALAAHAACGGRPMRRETLHVTLAFLGAVAATRVAAAEVAAAAVAARPFILELDRLACWKHNRIVWAGCADVAPPLAGLATNLAQALRDAGFVLETRPFAVHATLVRNANCMKPPPPLAAPIRWPVADFALVESHAESAGSRYEVVRRWLFVLD
ncbi:MAG: RNA 2',3'-cyclic phosphodiesterase [Rhodocyclaceae bacterium]|nr:RNA 2',3'-cyclic phosphodiesterase [Rhodocyclaceae bacterium]